MRTQDFFTYDACRVCGQTPCNCTHIQESYEARPVKDRDDFLNRREFLYRQLNTPGLSKQDRDVIRHAIQDLEASAQAAGLVKEDLRKWFKEKWVRFGPDGKIRGDCARGDDSEGKPKCLPQSKAHALGKKGRASAAARKRRQDPNPERKGAAINVATKEAVGNAPRAAAQVDYALYSDGKPSVKMSDRLLAYKFLAALKRRFPEQKHEIRTVQRVQEMKCSECGGPAFSDLLLAEKKDACYHKVRSRYKVWPSAYASGALVQCRKKGAANWGNKSKNEGVAEGSDDDIWGPQGNFAGDKPFNLGGISMKNIQVGDTVKYLGQKSKVLAMSKDRKYSRITILSDFGGTTKDVLTSDLQQLGQGVAEAMRNTDDPYDDMVEDYLDYLDSIGELRQSREKEKASILADLDAGYLHSSEIEYALSGTKWDPLAEEQLDEKCWDTHRQVGMKNKGGRMVPNCVPKESKQPASAISAGIAKTRR